MTRESRNWNLKSKIFACALCLSIAGTAYAQHGGRAHVGHEALPEAGHGDHGDFRHTVLEIEVAPELQDAEHTPAAAVLQDGRAVRLGVGVGGHERGL